jgi:hypothetical protein
MDSGRYNNIINLINKTTHLEAKHTTLLDEMKTQLIGQDINALPTGTTKTIIRRAFEILISPEYLFNESAFNVLKLLFQSGANPNSTEAEVSGGFSLLHHLVENAPFRSPFNIGLYDQLLELIYKNGGDFNTVNRRSGYTPGHLAAQSGKFYLLPLLFDYGCGLNKSTYATRDEEEPKTVSDILVQRGAEEILEKLHYLGLISHRLRSSTLLATSLNHNANSIESLQKRLLGMMGQENMDYASMRRDPTTLSLLRDGVIFGLSVEARARREKEDPIKCGVEKLLANGKVNEILEEGRTQAHLAVLASNSQSLVISCLAAADLTLRDDYGKTAIDYLLEKEPLRRRFFESILDLKNIAPVRNAIQSQFDNGIIRQFQEIFLRESLRRADEAKLEEAKKEGKEEIKAEGEKEAKTEVKTETEIKLEKKEVKGASSSTSSSSVEFNKPGTPSTTGAFKHSDITTHPSFLTIRNLCMLPETDGNYVKFKKLAEQVNDLSALTEMRNKILVTAIKNKFSKYYTRFTEAKPHPSGP